MEQIDGEEDNVLTWGDLYNKRPKVVSKCNCQLKNPPHEYLKLPHL